MKCVQANNVNNVGFEGNPLQVLLLWYDAHGYKKGQTGIFRSQIKGYDWLRDTGRTKDEAIKEILFSWESVFTYNIQNNPIPTFPSPYIIEEITN